MPIEEDMDWISGSVAKAREVNPALPTQVIELLEKEMREVLSKGTPTAKEQAQLAKGLLAAMKQTDQPELTQQ